MTRTRKFALISLMICFVLTLALALGITASGPRTAMAAEKTKVSHYFYNQLTDTQKPLYEAMEDMHKSGAFINGEDYDLVANNRVTQSQLEAFAGGDQSLLKVLGAARDAFYTDYNDIFYVDFGALSLRVTQDNSGKYHAYLGSGRYDTYYVKGFNNAQEVRAAIAEYEAALESVVAKAVAAKPTQDQIDALGTEIATTVAQLREAHKQIALSSVYRLETTCTPGNEGHVRTPYGVFVKGQALCEGYSRAFKAVCDELNVPCVLVNGVYRHAEDKQELHMWCHVEIGDKWYAVDQTFDDVNGTKPDYAVQIGDEYNYEYTEDYFLKGAAFMNTNHASSPFKSEAEHPFEYPELTEDNLGTQTTAHGLFVVKQSPHDGAMNSTDIAVSVFIDGEWCGYRNAAKKGYYIVMRHEGNYLPELLARGKDLTNVSDDEFLFKNGPTPTNINTMVVWGYVNPIEGMYNVEEFDSYTVIKDESKSTGFEFAVTTIPPREYNPLETDIDRAAEMTTYSGDPTMFTARSGLIATEYGDPDYQPAPHIVRSTPTHLTKLSIQEGLIYDITVEYDQILELIPNEDGTLPELEVTVYGMRATGEVLKGTHAVKIGVIKDVTWTSGGEFTSSGIKGGTISFKLTPSLDFAHDNILYCFNFNLRGVNSKRQVNTIEYAAGHPSEPRCYIAYGYHWDLFGQPQLLENDDLSKSDWKMSDGSDASQSKDRLALVVTKPSPKQDDTMNNMLAKELDLEHQKADSTNNVQDGAFESFTFNIQLTICKGIVLETGQGVRISVGFPEGFTYNDSLDGVTFTAYHFKHDAQNNIIGVEEIECTVTPLGLILMCKSFSPFAIVVTKGDAPETPDKTVILSTTLGGTAYAEVDVENDDGTTTKTQSNLFALKAGEKRTLEIKANVGYVIESVTIGNTVLTPNSNELTYELDYDALSAQNVIDVKFVAKSVQSVEKDRGHSAVIQKEEGATLQEVKKATVTVTKKSVSVEVGEKVELSATVTKATDTDTYQWYKDGKAINGQTGETLTIDNAKTSDSGSYTLKVTSTYDTMTVVAESDAIAVKVNAKADAPSTNPAPNGNSGLATSDKVIIGVGAGIILLGILMLIILAVIKKKA